METRMKCFQSWICANFDQISVLSTDDLPMIKEVEAILNASNAFDHEVSKF